MNKINIKFLAIILIIILLIVGGYYLYWFIYPGEITVYTSTSYSSTDEALKDLNKIVRSLSGDFVGGYSYCNLGCTIKIPRAMSFHESDRILKQFPEVIRAERGRTYIPTLIR